jgi:hypothetical protein
MPGAGEHRREWPLLEDSATAYVVAGQTGEERKETTDLDTNSGTTGRPKGA